MTTIIKLRRDTSTNWTDVNPILALGEPGVETDTFKIKIGDGESAWNDLSYIHADALYTETAGTADTVTTNAQPNITSLGTLTGITSAGIIDFTNSSNVSLGTVGNLHITGGTNGQVLTTDGSGTISWSSISTYTNSNVASYLPTHTGNVTGNVATFNTLVATGNANSINSTTGSLKVTGGIGATGNIHAGLQIHSTGNLVTENTLFVGPFASQISLVEPVIVGFRGGSEYVQAALKNSLATGSADWIAYADNGSDPQGWADLGFTSSGFNDPNYTITAPGDGYVFVEGLTGSGGNLVLATGGVGNVADIVFATGGFLLSDEFGRIEHANNTLHLTRTGSSITFSDGTIQTTAFNGQSTSTGNLTFTDVTIGSDTDVIISAGQTASPAPGFYTFASDGSFKLPNYVTQNTSQSVQCLPNVDTVIYTGTDQWQHTFKLLLKVEGVEVDGQQWDTQSCEMMIAKSFRNDLVVGSVYGLAYTSTNPLATFSARWNPSISRVEILCRPTSGTYTVDVRSFVTEITTSD